MNLAFTLMRLRADPRAALLASLALVFLWAVATGAQVIDRVLAVVGGEPITLSDVTAAERFGFVPASDAGGDRVQAGMNALIERQLQLIEVNRYVPPEPRDSDITARVEAVRGRFASAEAFETALKETGVSLAQLRGRVRDDLRIETYLQQRFGSSYQPSEDEVVRYYRASAYRYRLAEALLVRSHSWEALGRIDQQERDLSDAINEFEQQLFKFAEQARNNAVQVRWLEAQRLVKRTRPDLIPRFLVALESELANIRDPVVGHDERPG